MAGKNFNPLPRKEGDDRRVILSDIAKDISIHSLVKRETTPIQLHPDWIIMYFNPLPRKEGDDVSCSEITNTYISIHSLVKRETKGTVLYGKCDCKFQSTPS